MQLSKMFLDILENYTGETLKSKFNKKQRIFKMFNYEVKDLLSQYLNRADLLVSGSCGKGVWTRYPWIAIYNPKITTSIQEGVYIVYLFSEDMQRIYLTLNQGCTNLKNNIGTKAARDEMTKTRGNIRGKISLRDFSIDNNLEIGNIYYEQGSIFYKVYNKNDIPNENELIDDLNKMLSIYDEYYNLFYLKNGDNSMNIESKILKTDSTSDIINNVKSYIENKSFFYSTNSLSNFYLSLKTKPFVILAGTSGTGKSKLVRLFAEAIGATKENGRFTMISVKPDWNDSTELLGYKNINEVFVPGKLTKIIYEASKDENKDKPYFICLDEMNLARVEYYLSDYLSLIESREVSASGEIITDTLFSIDYLGEDSSYNSLCIPENLYIVGTVNMDDTTFAFSRKVLDRANTIEFSDVNLESLDFSDENIPCKALKNNFLKTSFLTIKDAVSYDKEYVNEVNNKIITINNILKMGNRNFGYRVRDEIVFYMLENKRAELLLEDNAFDYQIMQKILPTITGSELLIKDILIKLFNYCSTNDKEISAIGEYIKNCETELKSDRIKYKESAKKILMMLRGYEDGFTSFWA